VHRPRRTKRCQMGATVRRLFTLHGEVELTDHTQLVARMLREAVSARAAIAASYQRLRRAQRLAPG